MYMRRAALDGRQCRISPQPQNPRGRIAPCRSSRAVYHRAQKTLRDHIAPCRAAQSQRARSLKERLTASERASDAASAENLEARRCTRRGLCMRSLGVFA
eukprot:SAG11_NODE_28903_length_316_cov_0.958525_1_plen_99_part_01